VKPQDSIRNAMELLSEHDIKRLPVIDSAGNLVGFLTIKDILRIEPTLMDIAVERLRFSEEKRRNEIKDLVNEENDELLDGL
ncbi:MAG: CBS domain-containing protein, partial [Nanoarchaeota archaeon]